MCGWDGMTENKKVIFLRLFEFRTSASKDYGLVITHKCASQRRKYLTSFFSFQILGQKISELRAFLKRTALKKLWTFSEIDTLYALKAVDWDSCKECFVKINICTEINIETNIILYYVP